MAQYNFNGDIDGISERQLEFINSAIIKQGLENSKVTFGNVGKAGDNYVAAIKRITVEGENGNLTMIAKIAPSNELLRQTMDFFLLFNNEHIMYSQFLPKVVQLQKNADIPEEEQLKYAKCYGSTVEQMHEVILLEDLNELNFKMLDRFQPLSDDCIKSVLRNFAILHSLSYVLKQKEPETYKEFQTNLYDMWAAQAAVEDMNIYFQNLESEVISVLDDPDHINLVKHKIATTLQISPKLAKADKDNRFAVILQGDAWTNNIMFKLEDGKSIESIMIDYQVSKNASPVFDIMYMIFNCTDYETRHKHYYDWLDYYHLELDKSLSNFNLKANYVYPRDKLDADLKRYGKHMFGLTMMLASVLIRKSEDAGKLMEAMRSEEMITMKSEDMMAKMADQFGILQLDNESIKRFKDKVTGLVNSFTEYGLL